MMMMTRSSSSSSSSRRSMKIYKFLSPRTNTITTSSFSSSSSCYFQTAPYTSYPVHPQHGAMEETKGQIPVIKKGDVINLNDLLFTKHRDYLVKYNHHQQCDRWPDRYSSMLGFDQNGRVARKSVDLIFHDDDFPFCGDMEQEAFYEICRFHFLGV
ncbi:hypothetical protein POM88_049289 [Heracleum sosnowskyi]|uniref:Uncharacterized protein n=1 Tax=Heracleum sosnowskyi TaxID=360622 RepID=A0AAD8GWT5_9APIA|nr:hypothetical protein POM88_049289 [Heracleum sosnowskyi]